MKHHNITLIGMSGSGKSTLGKMLSERWGYTFIDTDDLIEQEGRKLQEIIESDGEDALLEVERKIILALGGKRNIFSPGGSCVFSADAMEHFRRISFVVFIDVSLVSLNERFRTLKAEERGIIGLKKMTFDQLFALRHPLYQKYADCTISIEGLTVDESFSKLTDCLERAS